jgi:hypothetical protein
MKLMLDHTQRLNLHALLGVQRVDVGSIRPIWALQDKLALDEFEEKAIGLRCETINGKELKVWDPSLTIPVKELDLAATEVVRIKAAIEVWASFSVATDRRWLEPLLETFFSSDLDCVHSPRT